MQGVRYQQVKPKWVMIQENIALICSMIMCRDENKTEYVSGRQNKMLEKRMQAQPAS
jgi:hypothetical protein